MCNAALNACWVYRDCATPLNRTMTAWSSSSTSTTKQNRICQFFRKRFNQRWLRFLCTYSFSNWLTMSCFSFRKAYVKCSSLSVNGIFDDVRYDVISTQRCFKCWAKFSNGLVDWCITMKCAKNYETVSKFVKVMLRIFWPHFFRGHSVCYNVGCLRLYYRQFRKHKINWLHFYKYYLCLY